MRPVSASAGYVVSEMLTGGLQESLLLLAVSSVAGHMQISTGMNMPMQMLPDNQSGRRKNEYHSFFFGGDLHRAGH